MARSVFLIGLLGSLFIGDKVNAADPCIFQLINKYHEVSLYGAATSDPGDPLIISGPGIDGSTDVTSIGMTSEQGAIYEHSTVVDEQGDCQLIESFYNGNVSGLGSSLGSYSDCRYNVTSLDSEATFVDMMITVDYSLIGNPGFTSSSGRVLINGNPICGFHFEPGENGYIFEGEMEYDGFYSFVSEANFVEKSNSRIVYVDHVLVGSVVTIEQETESLSIWGLVPIYQEVLLTNLNVLIVDSY